MRKTSLLIVAVLLLGGAMAAQQTWNRTKTLGRVAASAQAEAQHELETRSNTCFTMRSYIFARNDGEAPRLVGMTTCTPGSQYRFYHAQRKRQFGFYPAITLPQAEKNSAQAEQR